MRKGMEPQILVDKSRKALKRNDNKPILQGFFLSADYCSEHEWGIKELKEAFGCNPEAEAGLSRRAVHKITTRNFSGSWRDDTPDEVPLLHYFEDENYALLLGNQFCVADDIEKYLKKKGHTLTTFVDKETNCVSRELHPPFFRDDSELEKWEISAAWDEGTFGILVPARLAHFLRELKEHFENENIVIMMGGGGVFQNAGLGFAVADRLPKEIVDAWYEGDVDHERLMARHEEIGIEEELKKTWGEDYRSGCRWFALSPKWIKDMHGETPTEYDVCYWLNPREQEDNYFGWVTVEDLRLWKLGRGKIPGGGRNPSAKIKTLSDNEEVCLKWMIDRLTKDGCPKEEAEKYSFDKFIADFYEGDWEQFTEDAIASAEYFSTQ